MSEKNGLPLITPRGALPMAYEAQDDVNKSRLLRDCFSALGQQIMEEKPERAGYKIAAFLTDEDRQEAFRSGPFNAFRRQMAAQNYTVMRTYLRHPGVPMAAPVILVAKGKLNSEQRQTLKDDALAF